MHPGNRSTRCAMALIFAALRGRADASLCRLRVNITERVQYTFAHDRPHPSPPCNVYPRAGFKSRFGPSVVPDILALLRGSSRTLSWNQLNRSVGNPPQEKVTSLFKLPEDLYFECATRELMSHALRKLIGAKYLVHPSQLR